MVKQEERRAATHYAIVKAALTAFGEQGFAAISVDEIAARAGIAKGGVYHHFQNKTEIFQAVLEQVSDEIMREVIIATANLDDFWQALSTGNRQFFIACSDPARARILLHDGPAVLGWKRWRAIDQRNFGGLIKLLFEQAMDNGILIHQDSEMLTRIILGAVTEAALSAAESENFMACAERYLSTIYAMIGGLKPK